MTQITQEQNIVGILYVGSHSYGLLQLNPVTHFGQPVYLSVGALVFNVVNSESQAINVVVKGDFIVEPLAKPIFTSVYYYLDEEVFEKDKSQLTLL